MVTFIVSVVIGFGLGLGASRTRKFSPLADSIYAKGKCVKDSITK